MELKKWFYVFLGVLLINDTRGLAESKALRQFSDCPRNTFYSYTIFGENIFVGGNDKVYHLTKDLKLVKEHCYNTLDLQCSCTENPGQSNLDSLNQVKLLLVAENEKKLVACGTTRSGICQGHSLSDIAITTPLDQNSRDSDYIVSQTGTSVGISIPSSNKKDVFYFARTLDSTLPENVQQSVARKELVDNGFQLTMNNSDFEIFSEISVHKDYLKTHKIDYIYAFSYKDFTYFVTKQKKSIKPHSKISIKLARVCNNDQAFYSYGEVVLLCRSKSKKRFNLTIDAHFSFVSDLFLKNKCNASRLRPNSLAMLFILAAFPDDVISSAANFNEGTGVCAFPMEDIEARFEQSITQCNKLRTYRPGLEYLFKKGAYPRGRLCNPNPGSTPSFCPNELSINTNKYIEAEKALCYENLLDQDLMTDLPLSSTFRSLTSFTSKKSATTVAVGTTDGFLRFFNMDSYPPGVQSAFVKVSNKTLRELKLSSDNSSIYAMDDNNIFKVSISSACQSADSCASCMRARFLNCGFCHSSYSCTSKENCKKDWSQEACPIKIKSFEPLTGPKEGGTVVTIKGDALSHTVATRTNISIKIGNFSTCTPLKDGNYTTLKCLTSAVNETQLSGPLKVVITTGRPILFASNLNDLYIINGTDTSTSIFTYTDVSVSSILPLYGPSSGGTNLTISGKNLDTGSDAQVNVSGSDCLIYSRSYDQIRCTTTALAFTTHVYPQKEKIVVLIDGARINCSSRFYYKGDPFFVEKNAVRSIQSGGVVRRIAGENFNSVYKPYANLTIGKKSFKLECDSNVDGTLLAVLIPPLGPDLSTKFGTIEFVFDGIHQSFSFRLLNDPKLDQVDPTKSAVVKDGNMTLNLEGKRLLQGCTKSDYKVKLGASYFCKNCDIIRGKEKDVLTCSVPLDDLKQFGNKLNVTVYLGLVVVMNLGFIDITQPVSTAVIIIPVVVVSLILVVVALVCWCKHSSGKHTELNNRPANENGSRSNIYRGFEMQPLNTPQLLTDEILREVESVLIAADKLKVDKENIIGKGHFGTVYHGIYISEATSGETVERKVAVKTLSRIEDRDSVEHFLKEGLMMSQFEHENVLTLIGICMNQSEPPMVVLPYMKHGDLLNFVREPINEPTVKDLVGFGLQACRGMEYLSSHRFVHRDLAARNCMLDQTNVVKVADFGLARDVYEKEYYRPHENGGRMPVKWMALESLQQQKFTTKTDVWSFGILMWELMTRGVTPYPDVDAFNVLNYLLEGRRLRQPQYCPNSLYQLMMKCWHPNEESRPDFKKLVTKIEEIYSSIHGIHYPSIDVSYVNVSDLHPYPSLVRSSESRSTGGSFAAVFSPGPLSAVKTASFNEDSSSPVPPPRNRGMTFDETTTPKGSLLRQATSPGYDSSNQSIHHSQSDATDEEGYLLPTGSTKKPAPKSRSSKPSIAAIRNHEHLRQTESMDEDGYLLPQASVDQHDNEPLLQRNGENGVEPKASTVASYNRNQNHFLENPEYFDSATLPAAPAGKLDPNYTPMASLENLTGSDDDDVKPKYKSIKTKKK